MIYTYIRFLYILYIYTYIYGSPLKHRDPTTFSVAQGTAEPMASAMARFILLAAATGIFV